MSRKSWHFCESHIRHKSISICTAASRTVTSWSSDMWLRYGNTADSRSSSCYEKFHIILLLSVQIPTRVFVFFICIIFDLVVARSRIGMRLFRSRNPETRETSHPVVRVIAWLGDVILTWPVTSAKQRRDPCLIPQPPSSTNYWRCVSTFPSIWLANW